MEPRASISDKITYVGLPGSATTLAGAGYAEGTSSMTLEAFVGWPAGAVHYDVYTIEILDGREVAKEGTRTSWKAMHNGSGGLTEVSLKHGTMQNYPAGTSTRVVITHSAIRENEMVDAELEHVTPDGKLKPTSLDHFFKPSEVISNFVASGGVVAQVNGLVGSFSDIVYYINGIRYTKTNVPNKTYLATKDTYIDVSTTTGEPVYTPVANGATTGFALGSNMTRVAKVVTNATAITSVVQYGVDALGNTLYPRVVADPAYYSNQEVATGEYWLDGKPIYRQTFTISVAANGIIEQVFNIPLVATTKVIKVEGGLQSGANDNFYPAEYVNPNASNMQNFSVKVTFQSNQWSIRCNSGSAGTANVTIFFTK